MMLPWSGSRLLTRFGMTPEYPLGYVASPWWNATTPNRNPGVVMIKNEATIDRVIRGGISVTALTTGLAIGGVLNPVGIVLLGVGGMAGWTAISGYCPLYSALGISTCPLPQQS